MEQDCRDLVIECSERIARPAEAVWQALCRVQGIVLPDGVIEGSHLQEPADDGWPAQVIRALEHTSMEQRAMEVDNRLMLLRMEMTSAENLPWSSCQSRLRVDPVDARCARVSVTCLAMPTAEPALVEGMLRGLILLFLQSFKEQVEAPPELSNRMPVPSVLHAGGTTIR